MPIEIPWIGHDLFCEEISRTIESEKKIKILRTPVASEGLALLRENQYSTVIVSYRIRQLGGFHPNVNVTDGGDPTRQLARHVLEKIRELNGHYIHSRIVVPYSMQLTHSEIEEYQMAGSPGETILVDLSNGHAEKMLHALNGHSNG